MWYNLTSTHGSLQYSCFDFYTTIALYCLPLLGFIHPLRLTVIQYADVGPLQPLESDCYLWLQIMVLPYVAEIRQNYVWDVCFGMGDLRCFPKEHCCNTFHVNTDRQTGRQMTSSFPSGINKVQRKVIVSLHRVMNFVKLTLPPVAPGCKVLSIYLHEHIYSYALSLRGCLIFQGLKQKWLQWWSFWNYYPSELSSRVLNSSALAGTPTAPWGGEDRPSIANSLARRAGSVTALHVDQRESNSTPVISNLPPV